MNHMIHIAAISQIRLDTDGRTYYRRKRADGKKPLESLKLQDEPGRLAAQQCTGNAADDGSPVTLPVPDGPVPPVPAYSVRTDIATRSVFASSAELPHVSYTNHRPDPCQQPCLRARERRRRPRLSCRVMRRDYEATETRSYRQLFHPRIPFLRRA